MSLLGRGAIAIWCDLGEQDRAAHDDWHSHEHLPERVGIPGFLRGRRAVAVDAATRPPYFVLYEVRDPEVTASAPYQARLNDPTPWSKDIMGRVFQLSRTLCRVEATFGFGVGSFLLALPLQPQAGPEEALRNWLVHETLPALARRPGLVAAHLLMREQSVARVPTREAQLRARPDEQVEWVVIVEGYDLAAVRSAASELAAPALTDRGAAGTPTAAIYQTAHVATVPDLQ